MIVQKTLITALVLLGGYDLAVAWDGTNTTTGTSVEIEHGQLVRSGRTIEVYDSSEGYKDYDVDSIRRSGGTVEIEASDFRSCSPPPMTALLSHRLKSAQNARWESASS